MTGLIMGMVGAGVATAIGCKICDSLGESQISQYVRVGGVSLTGSVAVGIVIKLIGQVKAAFGG